ncbi:MAG: Mu-like prophage major head subunit gpT family protein [Methylovulum sp.]|nr:Mu-like prophage major head subunit gpT family protein [Methylovulum sp.]
MAITSKGVIGMLFAALEQDNSASWPNTIAMTTHSDSESEEYAWLGQTPAMREMVGGRAAKKLRESGLVIRNKPYESTLEIPIDWMRRDKTGQIQIRVNEQAQKANNHWAKLLSALILNGAATVCYDGEYFFDTDHSEGDSGTQSNSISVDIVTTTAPTPDEMQTAILKSIEQLMGFKDDTGDLMNEMARQFTVMVPLSFMTPACSALGATVIGQTSNLIMATSSLAGFNINLAINPRLTWTTKFATFRADSVAKPLIKQSEVELEVSAVAEGSELEFEERVHRYGLYASRNVGYGFWQYANLTTFT